MEKLLDVKNLRVSFHTYAGEVQAVRGVDFSLNPGETLAFVGESGCGKSVTVKALMRLMTPPFSEIKQGSQILYRGEEVLNMGKKRLCQYCGSDVSMVFQDPMTSLNPTMTCGKQITETLVLHRKIGMAEARELALAGLKLVRIPDAEKCMNSYPHQLSGGMRQRVMIAIALACKPSILIADEPTTALDVTIQAQIIDLLRDLRDEMGTAVLLVTHDLGLVANFADRIQVMYAGKILERGTVRDIFYGATHPYTWALLSSVPKLAKCAKQELYSLCGTPPDLLLPLHHCPFAARCEYCMPICKERMPQENVLSDSHSSACWLHHPHAPRVKSFFERQVCQDG